MLEKKEKQVRVVLSFIVVFIVIFLISMVLSWLNITKFLTRLGINPPMAIMAEEQNSTYTISSSQLQPGMVVGFYSFANDTSGNWNVTNMTEPIRIFRVIYPEDVIEMEILNSSLLPDTEINQGSPFNVRVKINNSRVSDVNPLLSFQIINPDGTVTKPLMGVGIESHQPGQLLTQRVEFTTSDLSPGTYTAEARILNNNWGRLGGFNIAYTKHTTFDVVQG